MVLYPMAAWPRNDSSKMFIITITGYYAFFCLFMTAVVLREKHIMHYCGFLKGIFLKSLFYVFLASLAFADFRILWCDIAGGVFGAMAVISWIRYCGKDKEEEETH